MSGTGPKAGGPNYLLRLRQGSLSQTRPPPGSEIDGATLQRALDAMAFPGDADISKYIELPGPTGESNRLLLHPRGIILCLGPTFETASIQARTALESGCSALIVAPGASVARDEFQAGPDRLQALDGVAPPQSLAALNRVNAVALWADSETSRRYREILSARDGPIIPLLVGAGEAYGYTVERHI